MGPTLGPGPYAGRAGGAAPRWCILIYTLNSIYIYISATVPPARVGVWCACLLCSEMICCSGFPAGTPDQLCRESAGIPAGNPPDWKNLAENLPDSKELTESQFFQGSRHPRNPENATPLKRNLCF